MRPILALAALAALAAASLALTPDLAPNAPDKAPPAFTPPPASGDLLRQGGDTVVDATPIAGLPYDDTGTTAGYADDYDEACPYTQSTSPDVVYTHTPAADVAVTIDLFGSAYDTKVYVYDADLNLVACNDDHYPDYVSKLEDVPLLGGTQYFVIIDGYGGDAGEYALAIEEYVPCELDCPAGAMPEGEPPLENDQLNAYNDGCGSDNPDGFQDIAGDAQGELVLCGNSGWFLYQGSHFRDTDWFVATFGPDGVIEMTGDAEQPLYLFELGPQDCNEVGVIQNVIVGACEPGTMTVTGDPLTTVWLWTGPTTFDSPDGTHPYEFEYVLWITGLAPGTVATETHSWGAVKALFR